MADQGYRKGYDQAMEKSRQLEDQLQKRSAELEQLLSECIRHQYVDEARASHFCFVPLQCDEISFPGQYVPECQEIST
jgi:hypothetical protein